MLDAINMFPYFRFIRIEGQEKMNHSCGSISSLIIISVMAFLLIFKLTEAFRMTTVFFTSETTMSLEPPITTVSTSMSSLQTQPFMLAFNEYYNFASCENQSIESNIYQFQYLDSGQDLVLQEITTVKCTSEHFSVIENYQQIFQNRGLKDWNCLPLDKAYQIGGDISTVKKMINIQFSCSQTCDGQSCGFVEMLQLGALVNPNKENPFDYYISFEKVNVDNNTNYQYSQKLIGEQIVTDTSLFPFQSINTQSGLVLGQFKIKSIKQRTESQEDAVSLVSIERGPQTNQITRRYLKFVDVFSYVGGFFPSLITLFFFVTLLSPYFYEFAFARGYFRTSIAKEADLGIFFKQKINKVLPIHSEESKTKRYAQLRSIVNKILDITCICRRIQYLERAISLTLEKHQLMGLHLMRGPTLEKAEKQLKMHRFKDRMITFLVRKFKKQQKCETESNEENLDKSDRSKRKQQVQSYLKEISKKYPSSRGLFQYQMSSGQLLKEEEYSSRMKEEPLDCDIDQEIFEDISDDELDEDDLEQVLQQQMRRLMQDAHNNAVSSKIIQGIDDWLKQQVREYLEFNYRKKSQAFEVQLFPRT